jgi:transketolase C-terminal domain/subunit
MGLTDYAESGDYEKLLTKYQLDANAITAKVLNIIKQKK